MDGQIEDSDTTRSGTSVVRLHAIQFLATKIIEQARRDGVPLSDVECNMLCFSESSSTLPGTAELNDQFERNYDQAEYEKKVSGLIRKVRAAERHDRLATQAWNDAVRSLRAEDYYLLVMIDQDYKRERPRGDLIKLIATAILIVSIAVSLMIVFTSR